MTHRQPYVRRRIHIAPPRIYGIRIGARSIALITAVLGAGLLFFFLTRSGQSVVTLHLIFTGVGFYLPLLNLGEHYSYQLIDGQLVYSVGDEHKIVRWRIPAQAVQSVRREWRLSYRHLKRERGLVFTDLNGDEFRGRAWGLHKSELTELTALLPLLQPQAIESTA